MDNKDSNLKPQQTGGLKLMTVFIAVLALHVVIIGSFTVYHLMSGGSTDADLAGIDKAHKGVNADSAIADGSLPNANAQGDKSASTTAPATDSTATTSSSTPTDVATIPANTPTALAPASTPDKTSTAEAGAASMTAPATPAVASATVPSGPTPAPSATTPPPMTAPMTPDVAENNTLAPSFPASTLAPPPDATLTLAQPPAAPASSFFAPAAPLAGPVHMPPATTSAMTHESAREHEHGQAYTVKITDSYKKIAAAHHITVAELKEANHIKGNTLHTGQKLIIPSSTSVLAESAPETHSAEHAPAMVHPMLANSVSSTATPETESHRHLYTVVKGDTLSKIAHRFKTTPSAIMAANSITDPAKLSIGRKLKIPSSESRSARVSAPPVAAPAGTLSPSAPAAPMASPAQPSQVQTEVNQDQQGALTSFTP